MNVLVIGGGGREHAIAWKLAQSKRVDQVFVAPGNAGTSVEPKCTNIKIDSLEIDNLISFAKNCQIAYTVVGPESPLVAGIVNRFEANGLRCFGPDQTCAQIEGSKVFAKNFMTKYRIPTADYQSFTDPTKAEAFLDRIGAPIVIKADGLAAGKGVIVAKTLKEAKFAVRDILEGNQFGQAGRRVVIEEFLQGEEVSFIVIVDGTNFVPLASSQDHKSAFDKDTGPNTGGMGAYSPALILNHANYDRIMDQVVRPTINGLVMDGLKYRGFLYVGIMLTNDGNPKVLEYNCRLGDPESQPILYRLESDLLDLIEASYKGDLSEKIISWDSRAAVGVVMAAKGYPGSYEHGVKLDLGKEKSHTKVFHAGTMIENNIVKTNAGRVLCVTALGETVTEAQLRAYRRLDTIHFPGAMYRTDIGHRAIAREKLSS